MCILLVFFFFKQKTAYEMRISDWSSCVLFRSRQMAGLICIACRLSSGGVTRIAAAKGGFLKRSVTIIDIAERAGVSFKTVSRVLNGAPTVAEELRDRKSTRLNSSH